MWLVKLWKSFLKHVDIERLQGLEKQPYKLLEEKPTKADLCRVPQVAQGVTKMSTELDNRLGKYCQLFIKFLY